jgi:hypothetical protein
MKRDGFTLAAEHFAADHRAAGPDRPGAGAFCDYCGATENLVHRDGEGWGCADTDGCCARRETRFPPDPGRVPEWLLDILAERAAPVKAAAGPGGEAADALAALASDLVDEVAVARAIELAGQLGGEVLELAAGLPVQALPPRDPGTGQFQPPGPQPGVSFSSPHTIAGNPAHRAHLLSGQARPHYYPGPGHIPLHLYGLEGHEEAPGTDVPPAAAQAPDGRQGAGDGQFYPGDVPQGQVQGPLPQWQAPPPELGAQPGRRSGRRRRGLKYQARRQPARRRPQADDHDFRGDDLGSGGPSGGTFET